MLAIELFADLIKVAGENGFPQEHCDFLIKLEADMDEVERAGGKTPMFYTRPITLGNEFQQGIMIVLGWVGDAEPGMGYALVFSKDCNAIIGCDALSADQLRAQRVSHTLN